MAERVALDVGDVVLLDSVGARCIEIEPSGEVGVILDLEGRLNKLQVRDVHRYILSAGSAAELIAELVVAAQEAATRGSSMGITGGPTFQAELDAAIATEQKRRGLYRGANGG
jgi:hypothetical protein